MKISILTLFPDMFRGPFDQSIIKRAIDKHVVSISYINIRDFAVDKYKSVDGHPFGGGAGMILRVDVVDRALRSIPKGRVVLLDAGGAQYRQETARRFAALDHLILICGHYEGVDHRIRSLIDEEISIGDYVLTGGELPAMVIADSIVRLLPGVLSKSEAILHESFTKNLLEYPQYTHPRDFKGMKVPEVLVSGNHKIITQWKQTESSKRTESRATS